MPLLPLLSFWQYKFLINSFFPNSLKKGKKLKIHWISNWILPNSFWVTNFEKKKGKIEKEQIVIACRAIYIMEILQKIFLSSTSARFHRRLSSFSPKSIFLDHHAIMPPTSPPPRFLTLFLVFPLRHFTAAFFLRVTRIEYFHRSYTRFHYVSPGNIASLFRITYFTLYRRGDVVYRPRETWTEAWFLCRWSRRVSSLILLKAL